MNLNHFKDHLENDRIFKPTELQEVLSIVRKNFRFSVMNTKHKYFNVPAAFDIETSSFYDDQGRKTAIMYAWVFGIYGLTIIGRTWEEFTTLIDELTEILNLNENKRLIVFVHNLAFDFQHFRTHFDFQKVFSSDRRKPLYALTYSGVEFRCSYMLSGYSLETVGNNLLKYECKKKTGDLNYYLIRTPATKLTKKELGYIQYDAKVLMAYIAEEIERSEYGIAGLPLTKTGYVRNYCRHAVFYDPETGHKSRKKQLAYHDIMERLTMDKDLYELMKECFAGGFTHANELYVKETMENVHSYDFTSSYPAVLVAERFPMGKPEKILCKALTKESFLDYLKYYCCIFRIHFKNLRAKEGAADYPISRSKCIHFKNGRIFNGRVKDAEELCVSITNVDFEVLEHFYEWDSYKISNLYIWERGYLPRDLVLSILELYKNKTILKGVKGKEVEYQVSKGMLNSIYGASVTDPVREVNEYTDHWLEPYKPDVEEKLNKYNKQWSRYLYFCWGIFCTSYSRKNLFSGIYAVGQEDYIYSDTDSIKLLNAENHKEYFDRYNRNMIEKLRYAMEVQQIPVEYIEPETVNGVKKPLGVWDYEGMYSRFKTLGAKRYMVEEGGELSLTVSGINKNKAVPYLLKKYEVRKGKKIDHEATHTAIFNAFKDGFYIPAGYSGKSTHTYIDEERAGTIEDYQGNSYNYCESSGIHLEESEYKLSIHGDFVGFVTFMAKRL